MPWATDASEPLSASALWGRPCAHQRRGDPQHNHNEAVKGGGNKAPEWLQSSLRRPGPSLGGHLVTMGGSPPSHFAWDNASIRSTRQSTAGHRWTYVPHGSAQENQPTENTHAGDARRPNTPHRQRQAQALVTHTHTTYTHTIQKRSNTNTPEDNKKHTHTHTHTHTPTGHFPVPLGGGAVLEFSGRMSPPPPPAHAQTH